MRLTVIFTLAALSAVFLPASASAAECSGGYVLVESVGGPLCVNPIYLDGTWQDDPATCSWGYFQGSCAPEPLPPEPPFAPEAYEYQTIPVVVRVLKLDLFRAALELLA